MRHIPAAMLFGCLTLPAWSAEPPGEPVRVPVGPDYNPGQLRGRVLTLTKSGIVIKPEGDFKKFPTLGLPDGGQLHLIYVQDNTRPPREFVFYDGLIGRPVNIYSCYDGEHRVADLQLGDIVVVGYQQLKGAETCMHIFIHRRPGGRVPPAIEDEKLSANRRVGNRRNAEQYLEEKIAPALSALLWPAPGVNGGASKRDVLTDARQFTTVLVGWFTVNEPTSWFLRRR